MLISSAAKSESLPKQAHEIKIEIGQRLFFDPILSLSRSQSCASCHDPNQGFVDKRNNLSLGAGSLGHDHKSLGDRNTPSAGYANQIPPFQQNQHGEYVGGMFWDGRESTLKDQAGGPPLNPIEMAMPDKQSVWERIKQDDTYNALLIAAFGEKTLNSAEETYDAIKESIAAFEQTAFFSPFDSKYDRYLKGDYQLTEQEELGMTLFFSAQFTNCNQCHQLNKRPLAANETFSDYRYHNIGVPKNSLLRKLNGNDDQYVDQGLYAHPLVDDEKQLGKFKTPSLRNVAITGPYMHNGVFKELRTVLAFYNKFNSKAADSQLNPETNETWDLPEIETNLALEILKKGNALDSKRLAALEAFLKILTDQRYEHLLATEHK